MYYLILIALLILIPILYLKIIKKYSDKKIKQELLPKNQGLKKEIIGSLALFGALLIGFIIISITINTIDIAFEQNGIDFRLNDLEKVGQVIGENLNTGVEKYLILLIIVLFVEEFFFRAFLQPRIGIFLSTTLFTIAHLGYNSIGQTIGVFLLGLVLGYWFKRNKSIIQNYFGHLLYDLFAIMIYVMFG
ncbi:MAG: CPBP family intramembrane metalloprotease [Candidatus Diapherotrites archaeon]|jgi:membrane protease YdiL (CAAX protease family)|uniref:CPBP family intramembrane metalloprotease n=1 Tax=Candidatus Iainarchaeum sp. TaxID=3101447 RepID=A0A7K4BZC7_9ARCH|nr:CPBP family intramembrane metalloprotease [Candidatus Diapherotrites archaeon]